MGVICWDLDETLGYFRPVAEDLMARLRAEQRGLVVRLGERILRLVRREEEAAPNPAGEVRLREGIREVLSSLRADGFRQVVTTGSFEAYARLGLERTGLLEFFDDVYGRERVWDGWGKVYQPVLDAYGLPPAEIVIVGDSFKRDRAADHQQVVLICQPEGLDEPAGPLLPLIRRLGEGGSFAQGFERLLSAARPRGLSRVVALEEGVEAALGYWGDHRRGERTPVVSALRAAT
jgi:beta-phosphoglucomutase-like phosphatase (HAD superfamily)